MNVQGAIAGARATAPGTHKSATLNKHKGRTVAAERLRAQVAMKQAERASRARAATAEIADQAEVALAAARKAARKAAREAAREAAKPDWVMPVVTYSMSAGFGASSGLWSHRHTGQDFAAPDGTPVRAIGDGSVISTELDGPYGRKIVIEHHDGTVTWYAHLSAFIANPGDEVKAGDVIGRVGTTGNSTGPHLHLEVRPGGGDAIEPMAWLRQHGVKL